MRRTATLVAIGLVLAALAAPAQAITWGQADGQKHPFVGGLLKPLSGGGGVYPTCTGTLIAEDVFLTAAHCHYADRVSVSFDERIVASTEGLPGTMYSHPKWTGQTAYDIAVVVLDRPVKGITPATIPPLGFLDSQVLNDSTKFTAVGYGGQEAYNPPGGGGPTIDFYDSREYSVGTFKALNQNVLHIWQKAAFGNGGTCYGDSGGPNFWGAGATETTMVVSTTITGDGLCKSTNVTNRMDTRISQNFINQYL